MVPKWAFLVPNCAFLVPNQDVPEPETLSLEESKTPALVPNTACTKPDVLGTKSSVLSSQPDALDLEHLQNKVLILFIIFISIFFHDLTEFLSDVCLVHQFQTLYT